MSYLNHGMALAGLVIEDATSTRFDELVEQKVFDPLKMTRSSFRQPPPDSLADSMVWDRRDIGSCLNPYPASLPVFDGHRWNHLQPAVLVLECAWLPCVTQTPVPCFGPNHVGGLLSNLGLRFGVDFDDWNADD